MTALLLLTAAHADLWYAPLGDLLTRSPQVALLEVTAIDEGMVTTRTVGVRRGEAPDGAPLYVEGAAVGDRILRLCGHPYPDVCVLALYRDGLAFLVDHSMGLRGSGSLPPGVSTTAHIKAMLDGASPRLCVRIGDEEAWVDAGTGAGTNASGQPVGFTAYLGTGRIDTFAPDAPVYVGRRGQTTVYGEVPRLEDGCVTFIPRLEAR